ncbi:MAG: class II aldolase/adducin family protein [Deltaproteobacteria bacterium]|nr:class II aldolase/adducin family protein [Deltaproteobacteria bacterium]
MVDVCRQMYARGYIVASDGNVSMRLAPGVILATPTAARKGHLEPLDLVVTDSQGTPLPGEHRRPSLELAMHVAIYALRPDVRAIVHAHPPCAVAHTIAGVSMREPLVPEVYCQLGEIITVPYTTPTTSEVSEAVAARLGAHNALVLARHGTVTLGSTLEQAYDRLETLEHAAKMSLFARLLAGSAEGVAGLQPAQLEALAKL